MTSNGESARNPPAENPAYDDFIANFRAEDVAAMLSVHGGLGGGGISLERTCLWSRSDDFPVK